MSEVTIEWTLGPPSEDRVAVAITVGSADGARQVGASLDPSTPVRVGIGLYAPVLTSAAELAAWDGQAPVPSADGEKLSGLTTRLDLVDEALELFRQAIRWSVRRHLLDAAASERLETEILSALERQDAGRIDLDAISPSAWAKARERWKNP